MGVSTDAILAYGIDLGEVEDPLAEGEGDLGHYLALRAGHTDPYTTIPDDINNGSMEDYTRWKQEHPEFDKAVDVWRDVRKELEDKSPIEVVTHCSNECPMYIVALRGTVERAWRGTPKEVAGMTQTIFPPGMHPTDSTPTPEDAAEFCKMTEIATFDPEKMAWLLFSMWS